MLHCDNICHKSYIWEVVKISHMTPFLVGQALQKFWTFWMRTHSPLPKKTFALNYTLWLYQYWESKPLCQAVQVYPYQFCLKIPHQGTTPVQQWWYQSLPLVQLHPTPQQPQVLLHSQLELAVAPPPQTMCTSLPPLLHVSSIPSTTSLWLPISIRSHITIFIMPAGPQHGSRNVPPCVPTTLFGGHLKSKFSFLLFNYIPLILWASITPAHCGSQPSCPYPRDSMAPPPYL